MRTQTLIASLLVATLAATSFTASAAPKKGKKPAPPPIGTFQVSEGMNRDYGMIEMRADGDSKLWPMFWLSHPKGQGSMDTTKGGSFTLLGKGEEVQLQAGNGYAKKIGGKFTKTETYKDKKGNPRQRRVGPSIELQVKATSPTAAQVTIVYNGKSIPTAATSFSVGPSKPTGKGGIAISGSCRTTLRDLGIDSTQTPVTIDFWTPGR